MNNDKIKAVADIIENIHWELIRYGRMDKYDANTKVTFLAMLAVVNKLHTKLLKNYLKWWNINKD